MTSPRRVTELVSTLLAPNPGPMTLDGTNSYVIRSRHAGPREPAAGPAVVVDPGPHDAGHLAALAAAGPVELILITHHHLDHTEGAAALHKLTGAPVRAARESECIKGAVLTDGESISAAGVDIRVVATPGHSADSVCFYLPEDGNGQAPCGSVLTGDTVLGRGTTVIGVPDGSLREYLDSLRTIAGLGCNRGLPAHGPVIEDLPGMCEQYLAHRLERLEQVRAALERLGTPTAEAEVSAVADAVYGDVDPAVRFAAEHSVAAQLAYLAGK